MFATILGPLLLWSCVDYQYQRHAIEDSFHQTQPFSPVDVLWVVDNSGSMVEEQELLATQFSAFADVLRLTAVDFRIGVTTTDAYMSDGALVGEILTPDTENLELRFAEQSSQGIAGAREEEPLETIRMTLADKSGDAFLRADAALHVIIVTDEDDQSPDPVDTYTQAISDQVGDNNWMISAIAGNDPDGCHSTVADATVASRIHQIVDDSEGAFDSICSPDFQQILRSLALLTTNMTDTFHLSDLPSPNTIEVRIDDVLIWQRPHDGWQYHAGDNAIVFDGYAIPRAGQSILVRYYNLLASNDTGA